MWSWDRQREQCPVVTRPGAVEAAESGERPLAREQNQHKTEFFKIGLGKFPQSGRKRRKGCSKNQDHLAKPFPQAGPAEHATTYRQKLSCHTPTQKVNIPSFQTKINTPHTEAKINPV